jgi:ribosomal protein S18 acetylase RimI-like enzyme
MATGGGHSLRAATAADVPRIAEIAHAAYEPWVEPIGGEPRPMTDDYGELVRTRDVVVAERGGEVVGLMVLFESEDGFALDNLAVDPVHQGSGVGRALLTHAEGAAHAAGHDSICLFTHVAMTSNLALYERLGYVEFDRRPPGEEFLVYMRKPLD